MATVPVRETIAARIKRDPEFARALLGEALTLIATGEAEAARLLMRDLTQGLIVNGFEGLAQQTQLPPKSLHRMLSAKGNPGMDKLSAIVAVLTRRVMEVTKEGRGKVPKPAIHVEAA